MDVTVTSRENGDRTVVEVTGEIDVYTAPALREELSRLVGCSREMVGRVLKTLVDQGLVSVKGKTMVVYGTR